jgi:hypothetical protein
VEALTRKEAARQRKSAGFWWKDGLVKEGTIGFRRSYEV